MACSWLKHPDDLTRVVYDLGTVLAKQNVRYAEVGVNPGMYSALELANDEFLAAINDGRDRAKRAWGIDMAWIFMIPRDEPRRSDDLARWATLGVAKRGGVVGLGLSGDENAQPVGQFERAFRSVEKKEFGRVARSGDGSAASAENLLKTLSELHPNRILDGWGAAASDDALKEMADKGVTLLVNLKRAANQGWIKSMGEYPLRKLYDAGLSLVVGADMPSFDHTTISGEYQAVVDALGFSLEALENLALNAVRASFLADEAKDAMVKSFTEQYAELGAEHIEAEKEKP
jgi:adenosine deaminase